jgi:hypothetical protein
MFLQTPKQIMLGLACVFALASPVPEAGWTLQPTFWVGERIISLHLGLAHAPQSELAVRELHGKSFGPCVDVDEVGGMEWETKSQCGVEWVTIAVWSLTNEGFTCRWACSAAWRSMIPVITTGRSLLLQTLFDL